jgi:hypothetical protein
MASPIAVRARGFRVVGVDRRHRTLDGRRNRVIVEKRVDRACSERHDFCLRMTYRYTA